MLTELYRQTSSYTGVAPVKDLRDRIRIALGEPLG
jgi:hypothetical protein